MNISRSLCNWCSTFLITDISILYITYTHHRTCYKNGLAQVSKACLMFTTSGVSSIRERQINGSQITPEKSRKSHPKRKNDLSKLELHHLLSCLVEYRRLARLSRINRMILGLVKYKECNFQTWRLVEGFHGWDLMVVHVSQASCVVNPSPQSIFRLQKQQNKSVGQTFY